MSDGSTDGSSKFIEAWAQLDPSVKLVVLTRNFGHQNAVSAGLSYASGACIGIMDADLQDEPEVLLEMFQVLLTEKVDVVYGVRIRRRETKLKRFFYFAFYRLYLFLADSPVQIDSGDFCVMSRRAVQTAAKSAGKTSLCTGITSLAGIAVEGISDFATGPRSVALRNIRCQTDKPGFLGPHLLFDKTIEDWALCAAAFFASAQS